MQPDNPYATPEAGLLDDSGPLPGEWSAARLRVLGGLSLAALPGTLALLAMLTAAQAMLDPVLQRSADWLSLVLGLLDCYLLIRFRRFAELRFGARLAWPVWLTVGCGLLLEGLDLYLGNLPLLLQGWGLLYYTLVAFQGLFLAWLGMRLLKVRSAYPSLRALGWLNLAGGLMMASLILLLPAVLPLLGGQLALALVFFRGARELTVQSR